MSLTKQMYFDDLEATAPKARIANINRYLALALRAACDCESPDYETFRHQFKLNCFVANVQERKAKT